MQYYSLYSTIAAVALVINLIINWDHLAGWRNPVPLPGAKECSRFLICLTFFFVSDVLWGIFARFNLSVLIFADTTIFFLMIALSIYTWTRYLIVYLELDGWLRKSLQWCGNGLLALIAAGLTVNCFTGIFFTINAEGVYESGPLRHVVYGLLIINTGAVTHPCCSPL